MTERAGQVATVRLLAPETILSPGMGKRHAKAKPILKDSTMPGDIDKGPVHAAPHKPAEDAKKTKDMTTAEKCADLDKAFGDAVLVNDADQIEECWEKMDELYKGLDKASPADQHEIEALASKFHHAFPRHKNSIEAIGSKMDAALKSGESSEPHVVHPAITQAEEEASAMAGKVTLHQDRKALAALQDRIAKAKEADAKAAKKP